MPEPRAKRCKHCDESGHRLDSGSPFWRIQLDQDLLDTISAIYPEWFKDYTSSRASTSSSNGSASPQSNSNNSSSSSNSSNSNSSNSNSSNSNSNSSSGSSSSGCSSSVGNTATTVAADSTSEPKTQRAVSSCKSVKSQTKFKSKLKKIEGIIKGRKDKRDIKENSDRSQDIGSQSKKSSKVQSSKEKTVVLKKSAAAAAAAVAASQSGSKMAEGNQSPPKAEVDDSPLQQSMDRNKESLKVKLMLRRPYNQLVAQGIVPPLKTPPAFHEQAKQLERRKTGDLLKAKIQQRPGREELVRQHILEDVGHVDPSLAERQRMLKKARLADQLNDQLSHRPGPLELIQKNILHTEEPIERAVKEGHIPFKATCEGQLTKPQHPDHYITFEDDSQSSEGGAPSPPQEGMRSSSTSSALTSASTSITTTAVTTAASSPSLSPGSATSDVLETAAVSAGIVVSLSIPTSEGAVVVTSTSPVFQNATNNAQQQHQPHLQQQQQQQPQPQSQQQQQPQPQPQPQPQQQQKQQPAVLATAQPAPDAASIHTFTELCNTVIVSGQELPQQPLAQQVTAQVADSPLLISIASPANSMSSTTTSTTTLLPLAPAPSPMSLGSTTSSLSPLSNISIASPPAAITPRPQPSPIAAATTNQQRSDAPGKDKNRKKSKTKSQPKTRTIKFHEYKGPPNAQKTGASSSTSALTSTQQNETSYELLLQQQQLFLQWQVEFKNKGNGPIHQPRMYPQLILPAAQKPVALVPSNATNDNGSVSVSVPSPASSNASSSNQSEQQPPLRPLGKLEDMKVSDLKIELKRRNLPVSGSKPQLIERLKPFTETSSSNATSSSNVNQMGHILMDVPAPMSIDESNSHKSPNSPKEESMTSPRTNSPHGSEQEESSSPPGSSMLKEHYKKKIEELQREIFKMRSQQQLQQFQQNQPVRAENKLVLQQHLHNKMQQQQLTRHIERLQQLQQQQQQQQQQHQQNQQQVQQLAFQQFNAKASLAAFLQAQPNNATATILDSATLTAINNKKNQTKANGTTSTTTVQVPAAIVLNLAKPTKINGSILSALVAQAQHNQQIISSADDAKPPPPHYDEAAKLLKVKIEPLQKNPVKSQLVDDVLEILINSGELPPSAAQEPITPTISNRQISSQRLVLNAATDNQAQSLVFATASSPMEVTQSDCDNPTPQTPSPPPPPPPLPLATFSVQLPSALHHHQLQQQQQQQQRRQQQQHQQDKLTSFTAELLSSEADLEAAMLLSPQSVQQSSPDPQPPQEVTSSDNANLDLKELGLDLDTMDFGQLDCDFGVKIETPQEFMDIGDMPMDMDEPDWLDSLMPQSPAPPSITSTAIVTTTATTVTAANSNSTTSQNISSSTSHANNNGLYDPLLGNSQDPFDLFNIEDSDFKISSDMPLAWDNGQVDFAT